MTTDISISLLTKQHPDQHTPTYWMNIVYTFKNETSLLGVRNITINTTYLALDEWVYFPSLVFLLLKNVVYSETKKADEKWDKAPLLLHIFMKERPQYVVA